MKTSFDLPDPLLRRAKALAAQQGRPLRDLVAEALGEKIAHPAARDVVAAMPSVGRREAWERWRAQLQQLPDGTWFNPDGIEDESFFQSLEAVRHEPWSSRNDFDADA